jgi:tetratricopeptide (TPR) repeat protein
MNKLFVLLLAGASSAVVARGPAQAPMAPAPLHVQVATPEDATPPKQTPLGGKARLPSFAPELAGMARISGPRDWRSLSRKQALSALARSKPAMRQRARWGYAASLIAEDRHADALGVLETMLQDDPDLALVANFQLAHGIAYAALGRPMDAQDALDRDELANNSEACFWRAQLGMQAGLNGNVLREMRCAQAALMARPGGQRVAFLTKAAEAALDAKKPELALSWLTRAPDADPAANIARGRAHLAMNDAGKARIRLGRAARDGDEAQRYEARLALIDMAVARRTIKLDEARKEVDHIRYVWRGGAVEERALRLAYRLARKAGDTREAISAGATLIRYFELGPELPTFLTEVQALLAALLVPQDRMAMADAAGLFWEYRDLAPAGGEGDRLVSRLADRLQGEGLYSRAAELLEHQLRHRALDIAQGPLSVRVATLHVLAGRPDRALAAVKDTEGTIFPQSMMWDRARIEAVALHQNGETEQALAILENVPDSNGLRAELLWKQRDWTRLVDESSASLPSRGVFSEVNQAIVLRHAIALGMLGREPELVRLRTRYLAKFANLPTESVFEMLTGNSGSVDPAKLARAMSAIPTASPAGRFADLLEIAPATKRRS